MVQLSLLGNPLQHYFICTTHAPYGICVGLLKHAGLGLLHLDLMTEHVRTVTIVHFNLMSGLSGRVVVKIGKYVP